VEAVQHQESKCSYCEGFLIILMDYDMPIMNGLEATKRIKAMAREGSIVDIPIVAVTSYVASIEKQKCLDSGMIDYINKPFSQETLLSALLKYMPVKLNANQNL